MALSLPSFGGFDFRVAAGPPAEGEYWTLVQRALTGTPAARGELIDFPSVHGARSCQFGTGTMAVVWQVIVWFASEADYAAWEKDLFAATNEGAHRLVVHGRRYDDAVLRAGRATGGRIPGNATWLFGKPYDIEFEVLTPQNGEAD